MIGTDDYGTGGLADIWIVVPVITLTFDPVIKCLGYKYWSCACLTFGFFDFYGSID